MKAGEAEVKYVQQGIVVVERDEDGFLVMFPDGEVRHFSHAGKVEQAARDCKARSIEWRDNR